MAEPTSTLFDDVEQWMPVIGYEGYYSVSTLGRIRRDAACVRHPSGRIHKSCIGNRGYPIVSLTKGSKRRTLTVHSLVAAAFLGRRPDKYHVNHISGDKTDARLANLEYVTASENQKHAYRHKLRLPADHRGTRNENCKLNDAMVREIRRLRDSGWMYKDIALEIGVSSNTASRAARGLQWGHVA